MNEVIYYKNGHTCVPNGVGDYKFVCPWSGEAEGFTPFMLRSLLRGFCSCGLPIELDEQPKLANSNGQITPCPKCDSPEIHVEMMFKTFKKGDFMEEVYFRKPTCLGCGHSIEPVQGIPPYVFSDQEKRDIQESWVKG